MAKREARGKLCMCAQFGGAITICNGFRSKRPCASTERLNKNLEIGGMFEIPQGFKGLNDSKRNVICNKLRPVIGN